MIKIRRSLQVIFVLVCIASISSCHRRMHWASALPEADLREFVAHGVSPQVLDHYLQGKYLHEDSLIMDGQVAGHYYWPVFVCGFPGRLYISGWHSGPPDIAENIQGMGVSWVTFGSHQVDTLDLPHWVEAQLLPLNRQILFDTLVQRVKDEYGLSKSQLHKKRYSVDLDVLGGDLRMMPESKDTLIEIQFYLGR